MPTPKVRKPIQAGNLELFKLTADVEVLWLCLYRLKSGPRASVGCRFVRESRGRRACDERVDLGLCNFSDRVVLFPSGLGVDEAFPLAEILHYMTCDSVKTLVARQFRRAGGGKPLTMLVLDILVGLDFATGDNPLDSLETLDLFSFALDLNLVRLEVLPRHGRIGPHQHARGVDRLDVVLDTLVTPKSAQLRKTFPSVYGAGGDDQRHAQGKYPKGQAYCVCDSSLAT